MSKIIFQLFFAIFVIAFSNNTLAADDIDSVGAAAGHFAGNDAATLKAVLDIFSGLAYVFGIWYGVKTLMQFKEHNESNGQVKITKPMISILVSTILLSLPSVLNVLTESFALQGSGFDAIKGSVASLVGLGGSCSSDEVAQGMACLAKSIPALMYLTILAGTIMGAFFVIKGVFMLPQLEQGRASSSQVMWTIIAGIALWSLLPMFNVISSTMGGGSDSFIGSVAGKYAQSQAGGQDNAANAAIAASLIFVQFIGVIAFARGLYMLKLMGENKDGSMGRALTHIFGGAASMNIIWTIKVLAGSLGVYDSLCQISTSLCSANNSIEQSNTGLVLAYNNLTFLAQLSLQNISTIL